MSRCCCHSFTVSLTFELPSDRGKKKDKKSLPYPGLKTNLFFVCCEVFAIAIQLLTKKNKIKKGNWKRMVMFHFTLLNFRLKDSTYLTVWQHALVFCFVFFPVTVFWDVHFLIPCLIVFGSPPCPSQRNGMVIFEMFHLPYNWSLSCRNYSLECWEQWL